MASIGLTFRSERVDGPMRVDLARAATRTTGVPSQLISGVMPDGYIMNTWYVAAWSTEVSPTPERRVICERPVVLFRTQDGSAVALADRCAHRAYPLSAGVVVGDTIRCGYHGFEFGADGACLRIPAQDGYPPRTRVSSYAVVERDGWIWVWLGDQSHADLLVPDTHYLTDPGWIPATDSFHFECRAN